MKNLKFITTLVLTMFLSFTSCQDEIDNEGGSNPNTNSADSPTASNLERSSMYDGSFDDFLDGMSCSSVLFPVTVTVNNTEITLLSQLDYALALDILGEFTNDNDTVVFEFPITVKLSNYTEVEVTNQTEYDVLMDACTEAENNAEEAINCLEIDYPVTILTYNVNLEQTGSLVAESDQELFAYMSNMDGEEKFAVDYPITATINGDTTVEISSDVDLQSRIDECQANDDAIEEAEESAENVENILAESSFKIESLIVAGVDTTSDFAEYTIAFSNDLSLMAYNTVNDIEGMYSVESTLEVFLNINFTGNTSLDVFNETWKVTNYSESAITLESTANSATTLVLKKS